LYLPLSISETEQTPDIPVFYGAVNIYLKQQFPVFRHMPGWFEKVMDSKPVLKFAAGKSGSTRAHGLEKLTESMLLGRQGNQQQELDRMIDFLRHHVKPDVVHFSNALLLGMARQVKVEVGCPVVCTLQDEDVWVDAMDAQWRNRIWNLMAEKGRDVDAFIAVSHYFASIMKDKMVLVPEKIHVLHIGVKPENYNPNLPAKSPPAIGYLSRICQENGFGILIDAFIRMKKESRFTNLKLIAAGGMTGDDHAFLNYQVKKLKANSVLQDVEIHHDYTTSPPADFFKSLTVLSVPVLKGEAFGLYQIEALASGIPLVQPELGAFPEIIGATGGGVTYQPNSAEALAIKLSEILSDPVLLDRLSRAGRESVESHFDAGKITRKMVEIYQTLIP
jgi:glycosyltransferase involved in cell wall biosynthesis